VAYFGQYPYFGAVLFRSPVAGLKMAVAGLEYVGYRTLALSGDKVSVCVAKEPSSRLDAASCNLKADECRTLAKADKNAAHRIMLLHMAETWERIASTYGSDK
jgi:hypothetical protein